MPYGAVLPLDHILPWQFSRRRKGSWMKRAKMAECGGIFWAQGGSGEMQSRNRRTRWEA
jgi:hypothetical protein